MLVALTLMPLILGVSKSGDWGWLSVATLACFVDHRRRPASPSSPWSRRVSVPLLDLALLRNRVLVGSTIAILIGAGTINGLMYLLSLYFQDPATLGFSPARGRPGDAAGHRRAGGRGAPRAPARERSSAAGRPSALGFAITTAGFVAVGFTDGVLALRRLPAAR